MSRIISNDTVNKDVRYSDFLMNFDVNPITGNLARITNENAIIQQFRNRILTNRGERFYNTSFGSSVRSQLFELVSPETADNIRKYIENCAKQESRITLNQLNIFEETDGNGYRVDMNITIINIPDVQNLSVILKKVR